MRTEAPSVWLFCNVYEGDECPSPISTTRGARCGDSGGMYNNADSRCHQHRSRDCAGPRPGLAKAPGNPQRSSRRPLPATSLLTAPSWPWSFSLRRCTVAVVVLVAGISSRRRGCVVDGTLDAAVIIAVSPRHRSILLVSCCCVCRWRHHKRVTVGWLKKASLVIDDAPVNQYRRRLFASHFVAVRVSYQ